MSKKILHVETNPGAVFVVANTFQGLGSDLQVVSVASVEAARSKVATEGPFALIICAFHVKKRGDGAVLAAELHDLGLNVATYAAFQEGITGIPHVPSSDAKPEHLIALLDRC